MNTEAINIKIDAKTKKAAQQIAEDLGFSLSSLVKAYLRDLIKTKTVHFSRLEEPSDHLIQILKDSDADMKAGRYREFTNFQDELAYLDSLIADGKSSTKS
jgi:addiction module RelB/DinJ family antitoxin